MSTTINARNVLDLALLQSVAECYLDGLHPSSDPEDIKEKLREGANHALLQEKSPEDPILSSATRFTDTQAEWFTSNYEIVTHYPNDSSGFSATLFRHKTTGEYTLSFRSTEYLFRDKGGNYERDGSEATDGDISTHGYALAQLSRMERFYTHLKQGETFNPDAEKREANPAVADYANGTPTLNVIGYSLGAHLSTSFTLMHYDGTVPDNTLWTELVVNSPYLSDFINTASVVQGQNFENVYDNPLHDIVMNMLREKMYSAGAGFKLHPADSIGDKRFWKAVANFNTNDLYSHTSSLFEVSDLPGDPARKKIQQFYGHGEFLDMEFVSNSGWHVTSKNIFIEDLPLSSGLELIELFAPILRDLVGEFGETHSITPLIDSLTVLDMLQCMDESMDMTKFMELEKAIANSEHRFDNTGLLSVALTPTLALLTVPLPDELASTIKSDKIHDVDALENTVNALHKLLIATDPLLTPDTTPERVADGYGNLAERNALHAAIATINDKVQTLRQDTADLEDRCVPILYSVEDGG